MSKKKKKKTPRSLSDQLRVLIQTGHLSRYRIAKDSGVDASQLLRFVNGTGKLTTESLDKIGRVLKLRMVSDLKS